ncbi:Saccharopine dehydrogenase-like oxidoreductase [Rhypophila decipiens]|uniref:Saccharopine dehydrogenase-like oxidoreductase n=1 Tax=Rhypophila decipiens TaxID=261697 RepID=A0AAN6YF12_9PEZI|nr:Saccharopine dehydrogenase-like oxidoreductase [Rhypophila decipiens]
MAPAKHNRQYDLVVFGATGYTGKYTAEHIATNLPTDLKWAVAGRSSSKLEELVGELKALNPDRTQPNVEVCNLSDEDLSALAKKTYILITTVGPYHKYGEHAFKACAEKGTHYLDVTGESAWVAKMIGKYQSVAESTGAKMFPQIGVESAPSDLVTYSLASVVRSQLPGQPKLGPTTVSIYKFKGAPSGGTLATVMTIRDSFTLKELSDPMKPYALSPVPHPRSASTPALEPPSSSLFTKLTGLVKLPILGLHTTSLPAATDRAQVHRTWGLFESGIVSQPSYGPNFSWRQQLRTKNFWSGITFHYSLVLFGLLFVVPSFVRKLAAKVLVAHQPGQGPDVSKAKDNYLEYRGTAVPDLGDKSGENKKRGYCRIWFHGDAYHLTGVFMAEAAATLLFDDSAQRLPGGVLTPACLGQDYVDRLDHAGLHFETKIVDEE